MESAWSNMIPIAIRYSHTDILNASQSSLSDLATPILKLKANALQTYDAVCLPLTNEAWKERWKAMCLQSQSQMEVSDSDVESQAEKWRCNPTFEYNEVTMSRLDEADNITGFLSDWLALDSPDHWVRHDSEIALKQEIAHAAYLNINTVILPVPRERLYVTYYGRAIRSCLESTPFINLSIHLPIYDLNTLLDKNPSFSPPSSPISSLPSSPSIQVIPSSGPKSPRRAALAQVSEGELSSTWEMWDVIRSMCDYSSRLSLTLDLTLPTNINPSLLTRWMAEPVRNILLPASTFIPNPKGYPVLPKTTQKFIQNLMKNRPMIILSGTDQNLHSRGTEDKYVDYVRYLENSSEHVQKINESNSLEHYAQGYQDYLQMPLQPLQDHLGSAVYENFEKDPVKYRKYEEAIFRALSDRPISQRIVICVAGAGRGPLVSRCLNAIQRSKRTAFIYAVEKNPNALVTLRLRQVNEWQSNVEVLFGDMRVIDVPEKADILVSELLGSFGDNELSPECLDGAIRFLKDDGISIPSSYSAHLAPLSSSKLYQEAGGIKFSTDKDKEKSLETPYVVMIQSADILSSNGSDVGDRCGDRIQQCWQFEHPRRDIILNSQGLPLTNSHNSRSATLNFHIPHAGVLHGFAGYFEAVLYSKIGLSIHPERKDFISKDMLSWFPCFFPIKEPLYLPRNSELQISIWRLTSNHKVWYEWYAESFLPNSNLVPEKRHSSPFDFGGPLSSSLSAPAMMASPLVDAADLSFEWSEGHIGALGAATKSTPGGIIKIGQTSLHNPGGRSSYYGL